MIETSKALDEVEYIDKLNLADDRSSIAAVPGVDILLVGSADLTQDMGIPGDFDSPLLAEAYRKVAEACRKASVNGRRVFCGMGGINGRPDLVENFARLHPEARYVMAGADNGLLLAAMRAGAARFSSLAESLN